MGPNGVLCQCLTSGETQRILINLQEKHVGGHYGANTIVKNLLAMGYWWPTMQKKIVEMCQTCQECY